ncbi:MAG: transposase [Bryobacteraceae bacterium]|nr:transposase [Bryobacteraceae bacterium]
MPRPTRIVVPGLWHHVVQRGNEARQIFFSDADRLLYLDLVSHFAERFQTQIVGFCLMTNHTHWIVIPHRSDSLSRTFGNAHGDYARYRNRLRRVKGHLWQARFYSCVCADLHALAALAYVERNPVRAGITDRAEDYAWSSAAAHCGLGGWDKLAGGDLSGKGYNPNRWKRLLETGSALEALEARIREATRDMSAAGSAEFMETMEFLTGRPLRKPPRSHTSATGVVMATG